MARTNTSGRSLEQEVALRILAIAKASVEEEGPSILCGCYSEESYSKLTVWIESQCKTAGEPFYTVRRRYEHNAESYKCSSSFFSASDAAECLLANVNKKRDGPTEISVLDASDCLDNCSDEYHQLLPLGPMRLFVLHKCDQVDMHRENVARLARFIETARPRGTGGRN